MSIAGILSRAVEAITKGLSVIPTDHGNLHKGKAYSFAIKSPELLVGDPGSSYVVAFETPAEEYDLYSHARPVTISSTADLLEFEIFEGCTYSGGTLIDALNRNRNLVDRIGVIIKGVTLDTEGKQIDIGMVGSGGVRQTSGGGSIRGSINEWVLKPATKYAVKITNIGDVNSTFGYLDFFYYLEEGYSG